MRVVGLLLALIACSACGPVSIPAPGTGPAHALEIHTCVGGATVWIDGAFLPDVPVKVIADANGTVPMPALPGNVKEFNVHATAPGYPEYGAHVVTMAGEGERIVVVLEGCIR